MNIIVWFAGVMVTWCGLKFVFRFFKRLGSKSNMDNMIDKVNDSITNSADKFADYCKKGMKKRKEEEQPIVTIR